MALLATVGLYLATACASSSHTPSDAGLSSDAGPDGGSDAGTDGGSDGGELDAGQDAGLDGGLPLDAGSDGGSSQDAGEDAGVDAGDNGSLPRIGVRPGTPFAGFYVVDGGAAFSPQGFNYIVLSPVDGYHATFEPGGYDPAEAEAALATFEDAGFNVARVFMSDEADSGIAGPASSSGLSAAYVDNFIDFLQRARQHRVYVVTVAEAIPANAGFRAIVADGGMNGASGSNALYLGTGGIAAKVAYVNELVGDVASVDEGQLLSTVLSWEIKNEVQMVTTQLPFSMDAGSVTTADGQTYDMSSPTERQACADNNQVNWANILVAAIHAIDPDALVSASVFAFQAVGLSGPDGMAVPPDGGDARVPGRPLILRQRSNLSFTDIHLYPQGPSYPLTTFLDSSEYDQFDLTTIPVLMGEFGAFKHWYPSLAEAVADMPLFRAAVYQQGFSGSMYWPYDATLEPRLWGADQDGGVLFDALSP